jgi:hypothetical protein
MKIYQAAALALLLSATAASAACERQKIGREATAFGMMRGQPKTDGTPLWKLANGITVLWCGRTATDSRGIVWNWVSTEWQEEPWPHEGWVSSRIVEGDVPTITQPNKNWEPSSRESTLSDAPAIDLKSRDPWTALVNEIMDLSSRQHNGSPLHIRFCEPEFKTCSDVVSYVRDDGQETAAEVHTDATGAVIDRLVCGLNKTADVRTCVNFDTKKKVTAMKDLHGKWNNIFEEGGF